MIADPRTKREKILARKAALWQERNSFEPTWRDLSQHILPKNGRFLTTERNKGNRGSFNKIIDSTPTKAARTMAAGMMAGMSSPARPWFRLATPDPGMMKYKPVQLWLDQVQNFMRAVFAKSNLYRAMHHQYTELGVFGTSANIVLPDFDTVVHAYPLTIGEYAIGANSKGQVDTLYREFEMPVHAVVREFGLENCSQAVQDAYKTGKLDQWVQIIHAIEPRDVRKPSPWAVDKPWASIYLEAANDAGDKFLRESGFDAFTAICPRWEIIGGDIYGSCPGMESLGDNKQLQHNQKTWGKAVDYQADPPVQIPVELKNSPFGVDLAPGGQNWVTQNSPNGGIRSAFDVPLRLDFLMQGIQDVRQRINSAFYADLFLMLANDTRSNITAREVVERHEEKMLMLGPVLERLQNEMHSPLIDIVFQQCVTAKVNGQLIIPPAPPEMQGMELEVEFISTLAQAQKMVGLGAMNGLLQFALSIVDLDPAAVQDKIDFEQMIDVYAELSSTNPTIIRDDNEVEQRKEARAAQAQQQAAMQQAAAMAPAMSDAASAAASLSQIPEDQRTQMTDALQSVTGYGAPV